MNNQKIRMSLTPFPPCMLIPLSLGLPGMVVVQIPFFPHKFVICGLTKLGLFGVTILSDLNFLFFLTTNKKGSNNSKFDLLMLQPVMDGGVMRLSRQLGTAWDWSGTLWRFLSFLTFYNIRLDSVKVWKQLHVIVILLFHLTPHFNNEYLTMGTMLSCTQWNHSTSDSAIYCKTIICGTWRCGSLKRGMFPQEAKCIQNS